MKFLLAICRHCTYVYISSSRGDSWATGPDIDLLNLDRVLELNCAYLAVLSLAEEGAAILPLQQKPAPIFSAWANGPSGKSVLGCGEFWYFQQVANPNSCWLLYVATDSELIETGRCHYCSREPAIFGRQRIATLRPKAYESPRHFVCVSRKILFTNALERGDEQSVRSLKFAHKNATWNPRAAANLFLQSKLWELAWTLWSSKWWITRRKEYVRP